MKRSRILGVIAASLVGLSVLHFSIISPHYLIDNTNSGQIEVDANNLIVSDFYLTISPNSLFPNSNTNIYNFSFFYPAAVTDGQILVYFPEEEPGKDAITCTAHFRNGTAGECKIRFPRNTPNVHSPLQIAQIRENVTYIELLVVGQDYNFGYLDLVEVGRLYDTQVTFESGFYDITNSFVETDATVTQEEIPPDRLSYSWRREEDFGKATRVNIRLQGRHTIIEFMKFIIPSTIGGLIGGIIFLFRQEE